MLVLAKPTFDLEPVLETLIENAARLCGADCGQIYGVDDELLRVAVTYGALPERKDYAQLSPIPLGPGSASGEAASLRRTIHIHDVLADPRYDLRENPQSVGYRTVLAVPMIREETLLGVITIWKTKVEPFTDRQIELVETFAAQAVIAIENVHQFQELQERTRELARSVEELRALGEVGQAVNSTLDLETVLTTIAARADQPSGTDGAAIYEFDEATGTFHLRVALKLKDELVGVLRARPIPLGEGVVGRAGLAREPVKIPDILEDAAYQGPLREVALRARQPGTARRASSPRGPPHGGR